MWTNKPTHLVVLSVKLLVCCVLTKFYLVCVYVCLQSVNMTTEIQTVEEVGVEDGHVVALGDEEGGVLGSTQEVDYKRQRMMMETPIWMICIAGVDREEDSECF